MVVTAALAHARAQAARLPEAVESERPDADPEGRGDGRGERDGRGGRQREPEDGLGSMIDAAA
jgi:hypothetical protein